MSLVLTSASHICTSSKNTDQFGKAINYLGKHAKALSLHFIEKRGQVNGTGSPFSYYSFSSWCIPGQMPRMKNLSKPLIYPEDWFLLLLICSLLLPCTSLLLWTPLKSGLCTIFSVRHRLVPSLPTQTVSRFENCTCKVTSTIVGPF